MNADPVADTEPLARLEAIDNTLSALPQGAQSLCPNRPRATPLVELVKTVATDETRMALATGVTQIAVAALRGFPGNLFWDFDYLVASVHRDARRAASYTKAVHELATLVARLMDLYGAGSAIRFRYLHDFTYGFDWARWMKRGPGQRSNTRPFDLAFLRMSEERANEMLDMIAAQHEHYAELAPDAWRNPFSFSREPQDEARLYRDLAERSMVPVQTWDIHAEPDFTRRYDAFRHERAEALGLPANASERQKRAP